MIKFKNEHDKSMFELEVGNNPTEEMVESFIKSRKTLVKKLVDFRKSQDQKSSWRQNRFKLMKGIKKWHKSTLGKRFHRQLGRFIATRVSKNEDFNRMETLKAITSLRTHLYIEGCYYRDLESDTDFNLLFEYSLPLLLSVEQKILEHVSEDLTIDEAELILRLVDESEVNSSLSILGYEVDKTINEEDNDGTYHSLTRYSTITNNLTILEAINKALESNDDLQIKRSLYPS